MRDPAVYMTRLRALREQALADDLTELASELEGVADEFEFAGRVAKEAQRKTWQLLLWARDAGVPGADGLYEEMKRSDVT